MTPKPAHPPHSSDDTDECRQRPRGADRGTDRYERITALVTLRVHTVSSVLTCALLRPYLLGHVQGG
jgi:hypothetical protein